MSQTRNNPIKAYPCTPRLNGVPLMIETLIRQANMACPPDFHKETLKKLKAVCKELDEKAAAKRPLT